MDQTDLQHLGFPSSDIGSASFAVRATVKALGLLCGILVATKGIQQEMQKMNDLKARSLSVLNSDQAAQALGVCPNTLQKLRKNGALKYGVHYFQDEGTILYHPDLSRLAIEQPGKPFATEKRNKSEKPKKREKSVKTKKAATRNFYEGREQ